VGFSLNVGGLRIGRAVDSRMDQGSEVSCSGGGSFFYD
jgi:hypothetical protein